MGAKPGSRKKANDNPGPGSYNYGDTFDKKGGIMGKGG